MPQVQIEWYWERHQDFETHGVFTSLALVVCALVFSFQTMVTSRRFAYLAISTGQNMPFLRLPLELFNLDGFNSPSDPVLAQKRSEETGSIAGTISGYFTTNELHDLHVSQLIDARFWPHPKCGYCIVSKIPNI